MNDKNDEEKQNREELARKKNEESKQPESDLSIEPEVLDKLPPEARKVLESLSIYSGPIFNPSYRKINEEHIHKALDYADKKDEREYKSSGSGRKYNLVYAIIAAVLFVFITIYLTGQDKELYRDLLTKLIIFFGGAGAGYGFKAYRDRNRA